MRLRLIGWVLEVGTPTLRVVGRVLEVVTSVVWVVGSVLEIDTPVLKVIVETFRLRELEVEEGGPPVTLTEVGVEGSFFVDFVDISVTCLAGFRGSFPNILKM